MSTDSNKPILTVTGSDGTGGAGVQADIKMISALGGYAVSAITSITVQNTLGIQKFYDIPAETVRGQIEAIVNDVEPDVVKVGMLRKVDVVRSVVDALTKYCPREIIYDPIIKSTRGDVLMQHDVVKEIKSRLVPICTLLAIKKKDAEYLLKKNAKGNSDAQTLAKELLSWGCRGVLIQDDDDMAKAHTDVFMQKGDAEARLMSSVGMGRQRNDHHGMSGMLTSAIATFLGQSFPMEEAVAMAYNHINQLLVASTGLIGRSSELYKDFMQEVASHCATNTDVRFYADALNVSTRYLAQVTKRIAGKTPKAIIDEYVCHEAGALLAISDKTVQEIAYGFGFRTQAHFSKFFRKVMGATPSEYRKNNYNK